MDLCKDKVLGGLSIMDLRQCNLALLRKWSWKLMEVELTMWKEFVSKRYSFWWRGRVNGVGKRIS